MPAFTLYLLYIFQFPSLYLKGKHSIFDILPSGNPVLLAPLGSPSVVVSFWGSVSVLLSSTSFICCCLPGFSPFAVASGFPWLSLSICFLISFWWFPPFHPRSLQLPFLLFRLFLGVFLRFVASASLLCSLLMSFSVPALLLLSVRAALFLAMSYLSVLLGLHPCGFLFFFPFAASFVPLSHSVLRVSFVVWSPFGLRWFGLAFDSASLPALLGGSLVSPSGFGAVVSRFSAKVFCAFFLSFCLKEPCFWRTLLTRSDLRFPSQRGRPLRRVSVFCLCLCLLRFSGFP